MTIHWTMEDYWAGQPKTVKYFFTGAVQTFVVPDTVTSVHVQLRGAAAGDGEGFRGSTGGYVSGWLAVNPGDVLNIYVGGDGAVCNGRFGGLGGWNGGVNGGTTINAIADHYLGRGGSGSGGATDVRLNGTALTDRVAVAGGAGGSSDDDPGGFGGGADVRAEHGLIQGRAPSPNGVSGGHPGSQTAGGAPGQTAIGTANAGTLGVGGAAPTLTTPGDASGSGGGGYYGGGAGGNEGNATLSTGFGGGGGSNYTGGLDPTQAIQSAGGKATNGRVQAEAIVSYRAVAPVYQMEINPNDGGSPQVTKNIAQAQNLGPNRNAILQEGLNQTPVISFSGVILEQAHLENLEYWYDRRLFIKLVDDLGREFYGVFSAFTPKRSRRATNYWYHTYDAAFMVSAYKNASGNWVYGRVD